MQATRTQGNTNGPGHQLRRPRVLLVDEDVRDRGRYRRMLYDGGFEVRACPDFAEGAKLLEGERFDCIVVDQGGPHFRGCMVLKESVEQDRFRPVVIVSRHHDIGCYLEAMQLGAVEYLEKPLSALDIVRAVTTHLQSYNAAA